MVVQIRGPSSYSHLEGNSIVSNSEKGKAIANVAIVTNDNEFRLNRKFMKLVESYSFILQRLLKDKIITLENP